MSPYSFSSPRSFAYRCAARMAWWFSSMRSNFTRMGMRLREPSGRMRSKSNTSLGAKSNSVSASSFASAGWTFAGSVCGSVPIYVSHSCRSRARTCAHHRWCRSSVTASCVAPKRRKRPATGGNTCRCLVVVGRLARYCVGFPRRLPASRVPAPGRPCSLELLQLADELGGGLGRGVHGLREARRVEPALRDDRLAAHGDLDLVVAAIGHEVPHVDLGAPDLDGPCRVDLDAARARRLSGETFQRLDGLRAAGAVDRHVGDLELVDAVHQHCEAKMVTHGRVLFRRLSRGSLRSVGTWSGGAGRSCDPTRRPRCGWRCSDRC